jgi:hypothetical protein
MTADFGVRYTVRMLGRLIRWWSGPPAFRVYGKTRREAGWRIIDVYASARRNGNSGWPMWRDTRACWCADVIAVGWDLARALLENPAAWASSRARPLTVAGGSLTDAERRAQAGAPASPSAAEILAHEIGHTAQALRFRFLYLPIVAPFTTLGEGCRFWNHFENEASAEGQFGGIVPDSVCVSLRLAEPLPIPGIDLSAVAP